jgi:hypothetical protein
MAQLPRQIPLTEWFSTVGADLTEDEVLVDGYWLECTTADVAATELVIVAWLHSPEAFAEAFDGQLGSDIYGAMAAGLLDEASCLYDPELYASAIQAARDAADAALTEAFGQQADRKRGTTP